MQPVTKAALLVAARHGLVEAGPPVGVETSDAEDLLGTMRYDRLVGLLMAAALAGEVVLDGEAAPRFEADWQGALVHAVKLEALVVRTAELLDGAGVRWRLTKGSALAHLDYPDPSLRIFGDADLVVHPDDWATAYRVLIERGHTRVGQTLPSGYDDRFGKGATLRAPDRLELDLHRRFAVGRFVTRSRMEDLFVSQDTITLAGREIPCLDPVGRLLHACYHAMLGRGALLRAFRDIAQLLIVTGADWETTFGIARSWRAEAVVAAAIKETWERLELTVEHPAHERALATKISAKDARVLEQFPLMPFRKQALTALPRLPPYEVPRYLWTLSAGRRLRAVMRTAASASRRRRA